MKAKLWRLVSLTLTLLVCVVFAYGAFVSVRFYLSLPDSELFEDEYSKSVFDRHGKLLSVFLNDKEQWHLKSPYEAHEIPPRLKAAVLHYEDKRFLEHFGIDILALARSAGRNILYFFSDSEKKRMGASTISMQVVKLYTKAPRTYKSKFDEFFQVLALEAKYSKDEILNMYLNNAPYGGNIKGFHSAALLYFGKDSELLTWSESALLAVLPNAPGLLNLSKNQDILLQKRDRLLTKLCEKGYFDEAFLELYKQEPLPKGRVSPRNLAPHLSLQLAQSQRESNITTTLNAHIQQKIEQKIALYHKKLLPQGILNIAALVLDTPSGEVLGYVGSQDFLDIENYGQIDGVRAKRSPGSLLKPFLYALSIDEGLLAPQSLLVDVPIFFSNFNPQNASKTYAGLIPAREALQSSLNVPFVKLLQSYGYERFFFTLGKMADFKESNPQRYGLSLILGSKEMSMREIARIYLGLANYGEFGDIYTLLHTPKSPKVRYISQGAAYLTLQDLKELRREGELDYYKDKMAFSWKSGTSFGRKDAWAAGASPKYTIVVWVGNFTGEANPNIFGVKSAGSLLFELLEVLPDNHAEFAPPLEGLTHTRVDKFSSYGISEAFLPLLEISGIESYEIPYPKDAKPLQPSPFYAKAFLTPDGKEVDSQHERFLESRPALVLRLPLNVLNYYKTQHIDITKHMAQARKNLNIIYPTQGLKIIQPKDFDGQKQLIVRIANLKNQRVFWYLNSNLVHVSSEPTLELLLSQEAHRLTIIGADGSSDSVSFQVE